MAANHGRVAYESALSMMPPCGAAEEGRFEMQKIATFFGPRRRKIVVSDTPVVPRERGLSAPHGGRIEFLEVTPGIKGQHLTG